MTVKAAARARPRGIGTPHAEPTGDYQPDGRVLAIGASTGGVEALMTILTHLPANCPPTVITQHMPGVFTRSFAVRLDRACRPRVSEAEDGAPLAPGQIYLAPGGVAHLQIVGTGPWRCRLDSSEPLAGHRPAADALFHSVATAAGRRAVGVILTGMGRDGAQGLLAMRRAGARTLGQDEASCVVYGMPKAAHEIGAVEKQVSIDVLGAEILGLTNLKREKTA